MDSKVRRNIVIAGASRGIGQLLANNLQASKMYLLYHKDSDNMKMTAAKMGCDFSILRCDVSDDMQVRNTFAQIEQIDVLINNAGVTADSLVATMSEAQWDEVIDTNLKGTFLCSKYAIPKMNKGSHIINFSSIVSQTGAIGASNYAASKGGVEALTRSLAKELVRDGIFVNCIRLGFFNIGLGTKLSQKVTDSILRNIPLHCFGNPMEIIRVVEFIMGSHYLVGSTISLTGGL